MRKAVLPSIGALMLALGAQTAVADIPPISTTAQTGYYYDDGEYRAADQDRTQWRGQTTVTEYGQSRYFVPDTMTELQPTQPLPRRTLTMREQSRSVWVGPPTQIR